MDPSKMSAIQDLIGGLDDLNVRGTAEKVYGTVVPASPFNAEQDCKALRGSMKGAGTDEKAIIDIVGRRSNAQRIEIKNLYKTCFGRDLIKDLESELSGDFRETVMALFMPPAYYDAWSVRQALQGAGTKEQWLIEILCTRTNAQVKEVVRTYKEHFQRDLEQDVTSDTSGHFRKLMVSCLQGNRTELTPQQWQTVMTTGPEGVVDRELARRDADDMVKGGVKKVGTDESTFIRIMAVRHYYQLRATFEEYQKQTGKDILEAIRSEFSGDMEEAFKALIKSARDRPAYFASRLNNAMRGAGTKDSTLIRIIVSRSEVDLGNIKQSFQQNYKKPLADTIKGDTSGDYRRLLSAIVGN